VPPRESDSELASVGNSLHYNSPDCPVFTGQCPVPPRESDSELASVGNSLRYNSPDCLVYTGLSGESAEQRLLRANGHLQKHLMRARSAQKSGTREVAHRTLYSACPVRQRTSRRAQQSELQRSEPNGLVTWLAHRTVSGVHRTVRCTMRQTASTKRLVWWLGL
jgi:hypothetical protein